MAHAVETEPRSQNARMAKHFQGQILPCQCCQYYLYLYRICICICRNGRASPMPDPAMPMLSISTVIVFVIVFVFVRIVKYLQRKILSCVNIVNINCNRISNCKCICICILICIHICICTCDCNCVCICICVYICKMVNHVQRQILPCVNVVNLISNLIFSYFALTIALLLSCPF